LDRPKGSTTGRIAPRPPVLLGVLVCAGLAASVGAFLTLRASERNRQQTALEQGAEEQFGALQKVIDEDLLALELLRRFYAGSQKVERDEFHTFTKPIPQHHGCLQALGWAPRVRDADRAAYEEGVRQEGFPAFQITERDPDGRMVRAARREEYFPVDFIEPAEGSEPARGFDLASSSVQREAMEKARDTGAMRGTERVRLVQETQDQAGVLVFLPVYRNGASTESVEDRRANLEGFAVGICHVGDLVEGALAPLAPKGIDVALYDTSAPAGGRLLAWHPSRLRKTPATRPDDANAATPKGIHYTATLHPAGRTWLVLCTPSPEFLAAGGRWHPWEVLIVGLAFTALLAGFFATTIRRTAQVEHLAARLLESNEKLETKVRERERSEKRYRLLFESSRDALMTLAPPSWKFTSGNPAAVKLFGTKDAAEFTSLGPWELSPERQPDGRPSDEKAREMIETAMREGSHLFEWTHKRLGGEDFPATVLLTRMELAGQRFLQATVRDITAQKKAEETAAKENAKLSAMISGMDEGVVFADADNVVIEVNDYFCRFVGRPREAILGKRFEQFRPGPTLERILALIERFRRQPDSKPFVHQRALGEAEVMLRIQPIYRGERYDGILLNVVNVTDLVRARQAVEDANRRLEELATTDVQTGLPNRRRFMEVLEAEFRRSRRYGTRLALAMVDVDRFKSFNDAHGHAFGDRVLAEVAKRLSAEARQTDIAARLAGDEFVILMPETSAEEALRAAERIREAVSKEPISDGERSMPATVSVGIATVPNGKADTPESLLKQADDAMYAAKEAGRNRVYLAPSGKAASPAP